MKNLLPNTFRFSPKITISAVLLAVVMLVASRWQWNRYKFKVQLVETYKLNSVIPPLPFPYPKTESDKDTERFNSVLHHKVHIKGRYDFKNEVVLLNRRQASGPGGIVLTPLRIPDSDYSIFVSRGFIPYADLDAQARSKYQFSADDEFDAVVTPQTKSRPPLVPATFEQEVPGQIRDKWLIPDLDLISKQLPYPVITAVFLERLGPPPKGVFPAESVTIEIPPSTHFGYTIEWIILAAATLAIAFLLQAFPRRPRLPRE